LKKSRRVLFYSNHQNEQTLKYKIQVQAKVGSLFMKIYLKSGLEEKLEGIGHGLEVNGGKVKQQVSDVKKQYEHLK
jgi:hypothetical protein